MSDAIPLPLRPHLDYYKKLARELLRASFDASKEDAVRAWAVRWLGGSDWFREARQPTDVLPEQRSPVEMQAEWMESRWRELSKKKGPATPSLADAQFFLAREHGFPSWPKFAAHVRALEDVQSTVTKFEAAVEAIVAGDEEALAALVRAEPSLVKTRSLREHHSALLHYCSANGVEDYRQRTPENIVAIARMLLDAGAEVNAESDAYGGGSTTLMLTATSVHPERVGVQIALIELLLAHGAATDGRGSTVAACLRNGRRLAAEFLAERGARLDLEGAAGVGALDRVKEFFTKAGELRPTATVQQRVDGFKWACGFGRTCVVEFLLRCGVRADAPLSGDGETGLHWSAVGGYPEIVRMLLTRGADVNARESGYGATPVGWAVYGFGITTERRKGNNFMKW